MSDAGCLKTVPQRYAQKKAVRIEIRTALLNVLDRWPSGTFSMHMTVREMGQTLMISTSLFLVNSSILLINVFVSF